MTTIVYPDTLSGHQLPAKASGACRGAAVRFKLSKAYLTDGVRSVASTRMLDSLEERE